MCFYRLRWNYSRQKGHTETEGKAPYRHQGSWQDNDFQGGGACNSIVKLTILQCYIIPSQDNTSEAERIT